MLVTFLQMSHQYRGSREQVHNDVESELQEAMSENVLGEESLLDGQYLFFNLLYYRQDLNNGHSNRF